jgi:hypothetical protein
LDSDILRNCEFGRVTVRPTRTGNERRFVTLDEQELEKASTADQEA